MSRFVLAASLALVVGLTTAGSARAQDSFDDAYETWVGAFFHGPITGDLFFTGDLHARFYDDFEPHWFLVRPGVSYRIREGMFATVGYAYTPSWSTPGGEVTHEHRLWEQFQYEFALGSSPAKLMLRTRLEQRIRPDVGDDVGFRVRQMARFTMPIDDAARFLFVVWDEVFFAANDTSWGQRSVFDQNRFFIGPGFVVVPGMLRIEPGYSNQFIRVPTANDKVNHVFMINFFVNWP